MGSGRNTQFDDMLYISGGVNLFSEGDMCQKAYYISRDNIEAYYYHSQSKNGGRPEAKYMNGMYEMLFRRPPIAPLQALVDCNRKFSNMLTTQSTAMQQQAWISKERGHSYVTIVILERGKTAISTRREQNKLQARRNTSC